MKETIKEKSLNAEQLGRAEYNSSEVPVSPQSNLTKINHLNKGSCVSLTGILTSNLRSKPSSQVEYMAFFRPYRECEKHSWEECETTKCQKCEIPVIFRIISPTFIHGNKLYTPKPKPELSKGDTVILEGEFSPSEKSSRPSFTCYSYRILTK